MKAYQERIKEYTEALGKNKRKDRGYSLFRLGVILATIFSVYLGIAGGNWGFFLAAGGLLVLFLILLFLHRDVREHGKRLKAYLKINGDELKYLNQDLTPFADGHEFVDAGHFYSYDLDLFGQGSLFHHINRSSTLEGKKLLARELSAQAAEDIEPKQKAVAELAGDLDFRQEFWVEAGLLVEDADLKTKLRHWLGEESERRGIFNKWLLYFLSALALAGMVYWLVFPSMQTFYLFAGLGLMNLFIVGSQMKTIQKKYAHLDGVSKSLMMYGRLLQLIEEREHSTPYLAKLRQRLDAPSTKASGALVQLSKILGSFDQLANAMGMIIMNALFLYHLHSLRSLAQWKKTFGGEIENWLQVVAHFDRLCSLGNFYFNHADFSFPEIKGKPVFEAREVGHPLIRKDKRVTNSIDFETYKYVVLTGSNMSGKSTFLKTVGINLVLAKMGAPVCASAMRFYPFTILSSMKMVDSIQKEESYFQAEILRLKRLKEVMAGGEPCFVLLDEILRGTNSDDKRNGTRLFMEGLTAYNAKGVIATHDIDIADLAQRQEELFKAKFFESKFVEGELTFDYKLRDGICTTPNATELMRLHGIIGQ